MKIKVVQMKKLTAALNESNINIVAEYLSHEKKTCFFSRKEGLRYVIMSNSQINSSLFLLFSPNNTTQIDG